MQDSAPTGPWGAPSGGEQAPPTPVPAPPVPLIFDGERSGWAGLNAKGLLLSLVTFGFYRFWLKTDRRRFGWHAVSVAGNRFEYRGTGRELLVGFFFAIALYTPLSMIYSMAGLYAETVQAFASVPFVLFTVLLGYYAVFRARRYRLTRTVFRGVRFWMEGSGWRYAGLALGWLVITTLTLGLAWPWMAARLEAYKMRHSHYGDLQGSFSGTGGQLFKALALPTLGLLVGAIIPIANLILVPIAIVAMITIVSRWTINGIAFGPVTLSNRIGAFGLAGPVVAMMVACALFAAVWAAVWIFGSLLLTGTGLSGLDFGKVVANSLGAALESPGGIALTLLWILIGLASLSFIKQMLFDFPRMKRLAETTVLSGAEALETVQARGDAEGAFGEGLADALGADGF